MELLSAGLPATVPTLAAPTPASCVWPSTFAAAEASATHGSAPPHAVAAAMGARTEALDVSRDSHNGSPHRRR
eukprot:2420055-Pleurochrysis_carterae.AAC.2